MNILFFCTYQKHRGFGITRDSKRMFGIFRTIIEPLETSFKGQVRSIICIFTPLYSDSERFIPPALDLLVYRLALEKQSIALC